MRSPPPLPASPSARAQRPSELPAPRRPYAAPAVRSASGPDGSLLLCVSPRKFACEDGCCDIAQSCDYLCNGG